MIYVTIVALVVLAIQALVSGATIRSLTRSHARREDLLVNQLCNAVGRPWEPAPSNEDWEPEEPVALYAVSPNEEDFDWEE